MSKRPGGELATRPLHFFWICDCSGSMQADGKIQSLNNAIKEAIPHMQKAADENPNAEVLVRVLRFSDGAQWHVAEATRVTDFRWTDLKADGMTDMGRALTLVGEQLRIPPMSDRALPPVLVLISDGQPTDDFEAGLRALMDVPWAKRAVRIAIAIGADADHDTLRKFIGNAEIPLLQANNAETLVNYIRWASTAVLKAASSPASQSRQAATASGNVPVPAPPAAGTPAVGDVW
ncbi:MAG TPA: VWA domain-containing protein [Bryobacteraceae bacterium]|nr:VWA domain-containing protein [Bryobacteraceae bacterium]